MTSSTWFLVGVISCQDLGRCVHFDCGSFSFLYCLSHRNTCMCMHVHVPRFTVSLSSSELLIWVLIFSFYCRCTKIKSKQHAMSSGEKCLSLKESLINHEWLVLVRLRVKEFSAYCPQQSQSVWLPSEMGMRMQWSELLPPLWQYKVTNCKGDLDALGLDGLWHVHVSNTWLMYNTVVSFWE